MKRWIPWISGVVILAALVWSFFYLKDIHPLGALGLRLPNGKSAGFSIRFKNARLVGWAKHKRTWYCEAENVDVSENRVLTTFEGVDRGSMYKDGKEIAKLKAGRVIYNTRTQDVYVPDSASITVIGGPKLTAHNVYWNAMKSKLLCSGGLDGSMDIGTFHGARMTADLSKKEIIIQKVSGGFKME